MADLVGRFGRRIAYTLAGSRGVLVISVHCFFGSACVNSFIERKVFLLEELFNGVSIYKALNNLITYVFLIAFSGTEVAGLG